MHRIGWLVVLAFALGLSAPPVAAGVPDGWHKSLEDGVEAAGKSGKPILLITAWARTL